MPLIFEEGKMREIAIEDVPKYIKYIEYDSKYKELIDRGGRFFISETPTLTSGYYYLQNDENAYKLLGKKAYLTLNIFAFNSSISVFERKVSSNKFSFLAVFERIRVKNVWKYNPYCIPTWCEVRS